LHAQVGELEETTSSVQDQQLDEEELVRIANLQALYALYLFAPISLGLRSLPSTARPATPGQQANADGWRWRLGTKGAGRAGLVPSHLLEEDHQAPVFLEAGTKPRSELEDSVFLRYNAFYGLYSGSYAVDARNHGAHRVFRQQQKADAEHL
jgi:hypothetical protein